MENLETAKVGVGDEDCEVHTPTPAELVEMDLRAVRRVDGDSTEVRL